MKNSLVKQSHLSNTPVVFGSSKILNEAIVILKIQKASIKCPLDIRQNNISFKLQTCLLKTYVSLNIMSQSKKKLNAVICLVIAKADAAD